MAFLIMNSVLHSRFNSIQSRILVLLLLITVVILASTVWVVNDATYGHSIRQAKIHSDTSAITVSEKLIDQATVLQRALAGLTGNFSVKTLIADAQKDPSSLRTAMQNFQARFNADIYFVLDGQNRLLASSEPLSVTLKPRQIHTETIAFLTLGGKSYVISSAPMKFVKNALDVDAWILMGVQTDRIINAQLAEKTKIDISLVKLTDTLQVLGSTFPPAVHRQLGQQGLQLNAPLTSITLADQTYLYDVEPVAENSDYFLMLATPVNQAFISYYTLIDDLTFVLVISAIIAVFSAVVFSKVISGPIGELVTAANQIRQGQYVSQFPRCSTNEVNSLSQAISEMQIGIKQRESQINQLAYFDPLTGLPNRNQFNLEIEKHFAKTSPAYLMIALLDVDRFKEINDTVGHQTGDKLLKLITERLQYHASKEDFYARTGGDEFAIIFGATNTQNAALVAQKIMFVFEQPFVIDNLVLDVDVSIGIAQYPMHADSAQQLIQCADIALYSCKEQHESFVIYEPHLNKYSLQRLNLMSELKEALLSGQLELYFQPKLNIADNCVTNVECLIRWIHPTHGFISPDEFIGLAEQTGAIRALTQWVLNQALAQVRDWQNKGRNIGVAVNISAMDLVDLRFSGYVSQLLTEYGIAPNMLTLEITESAIMSDPDTAIKSLQTLRNMGVYLSIDDFGTGFSSMAQLKKMPVHELKIDKAFVLDLATNNDDKVMVNTLVSLAQNLGLTTVAEGVEDEDSLHYLAQSGCTKAQGFYMSKPLPLDQFDSWFSAHSTMRELPS